MGSGGMSEKEKVESCRRIVVSWLLSRLQPGPAKQMLRQISNCNVNGVNMSLKDFSLQVGTQVSGCLLPSMLSDATLDPVTGVSFTCDLNDNIAALWPASLQASTSSCNKSVNFPALPAATETKTNVERALISC